MIRTIKLDGWKLSIFSEFREDVIQSADELITLHYSLIRETKDGAVICIEFQNVDYAQMRYETELPSFGSGSLYACVDKADEVAKAVHGGWKFMYLEFDADGMVSPRNSPR